MIQRVFLLGLLALGVAVGTQRASAQVPQSYGQYYTQHTPNTGSYRAAGTNRYLYDKYFYHRPTVSPYVNLARGGDAYQEFVRPEQQRRQQDEMAKAAYIQEKKLRGDFGHTNYDLALARQGSGGVALPKQVRTPNAYYNHWYGNQGRR